MDNGDEIQIFFNKPINTKRLTIDSITTNRLKLGSGAKFYSKYKNVQFSKIFILKLGDNPTIKRGDILGFDKNNIVDNSLNNPTNNLSAKVPYIEILQVISSKLLDKNSDEICNSNDILTFKLNRKIEVTPLSVNNIRFNGSFLTTSNSSITAINPINNYSDEFEIKFKSTFDMKIYDVYLKSSSTIDEYSLSPKMDILFKINDIITPKKLASEVILRDLDFTMSYSSGDTIIFRFTEPINSALIDIKKNINLSDKGSFGDDPKIISLGWTNELKVKLSENTYLPTNTTIIFDKNHIVDKVGNIAKNNISFTIPSLDIPRITDITIPDGNYKAGDKIPIKVHFSRDIGVNKNNSLIYIQTKIGNSIFSPQYSYQEDNKKIVFILDITTGLDLDGIEILENSLTLTGEAKISVNNINANLNHKKYFFKNVKVDIPFSLYASSFFWLDSKDVNGDLDINNQTNNTKLDRWIDKSMNKFIFEGNNNGPDITSDGLLFNGSDTSITYSDRSNALGNSISLFSVLHASEAKVQDALVNYII